ncbi:MAG: alpha/beta hydrolase [Gemmataceae bacterium]
MAACYSLFFALGLFAPHAWPQEPPFYDDKTQLLIYRDRAGIAHKIDTPEDWQKRRTHILANMQLVMGPLPAADRKVPLDLRVLEEVERDGLVRKKVSFAVEQGDRVAAYLFLPAKQTGKLPAIVCFHQTNGKLGKREPAGLGGRKAYRYGLELARRGYVTLCPDYPYFGDSSDIDVYKFGYQSGTMKAIWNNMCAVDLLQSLPQVDGEKIGAIGHSLGGHNAMYTAAFDQRIKAIVSCCGFNAFPKYYGGNLKGWSSNRYMPRIDTVYECNPKKMPFDFPEVVAALAPRPFLTVSPLKDSNFEVSGVKDCIVAATPVYGLLGAKDKLSAPHPDCGHDFPPDMRKAAYEWFDRWLR